MLQNPSSLNQQAFILCLLYVKMQEEGDTELSTIWSLPSKGLSSKGIVSSEVMRHDGTHPNPSTEAEAIGSQIQA